MLCPVCKTVNLAMTDRQGIEVDYCPACRGIWLDRGELDRLIERAERAEHAERAGQSAAPAPAQAPPQYGHPYPAPQHSHEGYRHGKKRPKSLLGELFDF